MIRLAVRVARAEAEVALAALLELAPSGVEEVDVDDGVVEYAVYGAPGELPALPDLRAAAGPALVEVSTSEVADDWAQRWREFHRPVLVHAGGRTVRVRPPWEPAHPAPDPAIDPAIDLVIDPGQAFGTGAHPTTRACLELLLELAGEGRAAGTLLDVGCGSGVLAIAAAKLGWAPVAAVDHDRLAVEATVANARANGAPVSVSRLDVRRDELPGASVVVANLLAPLVRELAANLREIPRTIVVGGLLAEEADAAAVPFATLGLAPGARRELEGWAAVRLDR